MRCFSETLCMREPRDLCFYKFVVVVLHIQNLWESLKDPEKFVLKSAKKSDNNGKKASG